MEQYPLWLVEALDDLNKGVEEVPGPGNNPDIVAYHHYTTLDAKDDATPWCASTMCAWLERAGVRSPRSAAAADFRKWGRELGDGEQRLGVIAVLTRPGGNHVALYLDEDDSGIYCLGGNQGDRVSIRHYPWDNVTNFRWPN
ncbi:MAG: TIGR02594 family protein [Syntrophales bacterium]|nr:TIGR02594 family protein [Syntrophales bacterium]